jgi:hypothetical protein
MKPVRRTHRRGRALLAATGLGLAVAAGCGGESEIVPPGVVPCAADAGCGVVIFPDSGQPDSGLPDAGFPGILIPDGG